ncbi:MAG: glycosyltransferase family 4 protein [Solirubrobacteraceae bacterium]
MRVAFDSRPATDGGGIGRYARCLLRALRSTSAGGLELFESHKPRGVDVYHSPWMQGTILRSPCPMVVTIHDLAALKRRSEHLRSATLPRLKHLAVQRATEVIVPTRAVARDAISHLDIDADRISVIPEASDPSLRPCSEAEIASVRSRHRLPERYLVWVGGMQRPDPRRHIARLAATPRELPLVLVGKAGRWAQELSGVTLTGQVSDADLAAIYSGAHGLVLASQDEGFGLPAVEALACGTPVAAFDQPALREVLGEKATLVEPGDFTGLMRAASALRRPAPAPPTWTWEDAGHATWSVYKRADARRDATCLSAARRHSAARTGGAARTSPVRSGGAARTAAS